MKPLIDNDFRAKGYQITRGLIDETVLHQMQTTLQEALEPTIEAMQELGIRVNSTDMGSDIKVLLDDPKANKIDRDLRLIMTGQYPLSVRMDPRLLIVAQNIQVQKFLTRLLGESSLRMHMPPTARFVWPENTSASVPTHQDATYNQHISDFITLWVPLVSIDKECGGVTVFPGTDKAELKTQIMDHGIWYDPLDISDHTAIDCAPMEPGDVLVFNRFIAHKSMPNTSNRIRLSVDYRFFGASSTSKKHYLDVQNWKVINPNE